MNMKTRNNNKTNKNSKRLSPRQRQLLFRRFATIISVFILGFVLAMIISGINNRVNASDKYYKYFTSIEVHPGDTLYGYALEYGDHYDTKEKFIKEVCNINYIEADDIKAGMNLIVPYYSTELK